jgi:probable rRNA maturation factor
MVDLAVAGPLKAALPAALWRRLGVELRRMARAAARAEGLDDVEVAVRLVDDDEIHALNRAYRKKDRPTDVLAFAQREGPGGALHPELLGDVIISVPTARRQASARKRRGPLGLYGELLFLASHGLCHLLGYDHRDDAEEAEMNARMAALRAEAARRGRVRAA